MENKELANRIKALRNRKGFSQRELSEKAGLSLRTIQRIENGETLPLGDSLRRIAAAFEVSSDEILDWAVHEDKGFLVNLNQTALSFLVFPLLGVIVPLVIWISKKDKIKDINKVARNLLNFQITWTIILFFGFIALIFCMMSFDTGNETISPTYIASEINSMLLINYSFVAFMYLYNIVLVIINSTRINKEKEVRYFPKINVIKK